MLIAKIARIAKIANVDRDTYKGSATRPPLSAF
jgi:hypothetical protein